MVFGRRLSHGRAAVAVLTSLLCSYHLTDSHHAVMPSTTEPYSTGTPSASLEDTGNATGGLYLADVIPNARKHAPIDGRKSPQEDGVERADMLEAYEAGAATPDKAVRSDSDMSGTGIS